MPAVRARPEGAPDRSRPPPAPIALTPGPVKISPEVARGLANPQISHHREAAFCDLHARLCADIPALLQIRSRDSYGVATLTTTGTGANEACLMALRRLGPGLVVSNGYFGERAIATARANGIAHHAHRLPADAPVDPDRIRDILGANPALRWIFFVSHETRVGLKNPTAAIASVARDRGLFTAVDALSSAFAYPVDFEGSGVDLIVTTSAKALGAAPGLGIFLVSRAGQRRLSGACAPARGYYLDLVAELEAQQRTHQPRFAQPVALYAAAAAATARLERIGIAAHMARIQRQMGWIIDELAAVAVRPLLREAWRSNVVVNFALPAGWDYPRIAAHMRTAGYFVSCGVPGDQPHFQLSTLGALDDDDIGGAIAALKGALGPARAGAP